jgi:hypothetical protein
MPTAGILENCLVVFRLNSSDKKRISLDRNVKRLEIKHLWDIESKGNLSDLTFLESKYFPENVILVKTNSTDHESLVSMHKQVGPGERSTILHFQHSFDRCLFGKDECSVDGEGNPIEVLNPENFQPLETGINEGKTKEIVIAVLDTGIDPELIPEEYLWVDPDAPKVESYLENLANGVYGRNFVADTESTAKEIDGRMVMGDPENLAIKDDHPLLHGTMMCAYIINQFRHSEYAVKIMCLKTHRADGTGSLDDVYRAINYARYHGATFINASWAFPAREVESYSILKDVIQHDLSDSGTLFVTVAGNRDVNSPDQHYYPAKFRSKSAGLRMGVMVAATVSKDKTEVSTSEMSNNLYVDFGVPCDKETSAGFLFELPLNAKSGQKYYQQGSSIAAAITTGFLASVFPEPLIENNILRNKLGILEYDENNSFSRYPELTGGIIGGRVLNTATQKGS